MLVTQFTGHTPLNKRHEQQDIGNLEENKRTQSLQDLSKLHDYKEVTSEPFRERSNTL